MRILPSALVIAAAACATAPTAHAGIWTPVPSGTTETITALDHRPTGTVFGTANGKIFTLAGGERKSFPGLSVVDLAMNPSGTKGVAALTNGKFSDTIDGGVTWTGPWTLATFRPSEDSCPFTPSAGGGAVTQDTTAVAWASDSVSYITNRLRGSLHRTSNGWQTWSEVSRNAAGGCRFDPGSNSPVTGVAPVLGSNTVYFVTRSFGKVFYSGDAVATSPLARAESVNCFDRSPAIAVDTAAPNRLVVGDGCPDGLSLQFSEDGGNTFRALRRGPDDNVPVHGQQDVSFVGGTAIWAGDDGDILTSTDGRTAHPQPADGADATRDWKAVSAYSAANAAVAGEGGVLLVTSAANTIPASSSAAAPAPSPASSTAPPAGAATTPAPARLTPGGRTTTSIPGASITLKGPKACVRPGVPFTATMSMKRAKRKGNRVVRLSRVEFFVDGRKVKTDRRAPFVQRLTVAGAAPGSVHVLRARGTIRLRKGKPRAKSATVTFSVCA